jgi:hypothetical protein
VELDGRQYKFEFLLADVRFPIIGIDFLCFFNLIVDVTADCLLPRAALAQPVGGPPAGVLSGAGSHRQRSKNGSDYPFWAL